MWMSSKFLLCLVFFTSGSRINVNAALLAMAFLASSSWIILLICKKKRLLQGQSKV